ncbi:hypothetical protein MNBD_ALPHA08-1214 [hydrothermal vent metagenome]|uniref:Transmembrane protein n=1 Tax=hydrothermal vent metagenome TaxID=652676 RepID=A0A3B0SAG5_9ZZZZ
MSETETAKKPDPTFLKYDKMDLKKPLGLVIEKRQQVLEDEPKGPRLTRKEFEALLDDYYAVSDGTDDSEQSIPPSILPKAPHHARAAGGRMVRNLALASCLALFLGFGLGLYGLSQQGGETRLGQKFNQSLAELWQMVQPTAIGGKIKTAVAAGSDQKQTTRKQAGASPAAKPIKTASLVVANSSGTVLAGIPLKLSLNADTDASLLQIKIMNVPGDAVLTAGTRRSDGVWILKPSDLNNVSLVVSSDRQTPLRLDIELIEAKTGELMSPTREIKVAIVPPKPFKVGRL